MEIVANNHSQPRSLAIQGRPSNDTEVVAAGRNSASSEDALLIIDDRALDRECFAQILISRGIGMNIFHCGSIESFRQRREEIPELSAIALNIGGKKITDPMVTETIKKLNTEFDRKPIILLADTDELPQILRALDYGVNAFIPTSVGIDVCIEAIKLAMAGGVFVPVSSVLAMRRLVEAGSDNYPMASMFTQRQVEVVEALRRGKANKIIAYELNLRESTVKVHIRNIMRKLKATNRTEVAFKINDLFPDYSVPTTQQRSNQK